MILFDASTLILLAKIELLDLFFDSFPEKAAITKEVEKECCRKRQAIDSVAIQNAIKEKRIAVSALKSRSFIRSCERILVSETEKQKLLRWL